MQIGKKTIIAFTWEFFGNISVQGVNLFLSIVLARLLNPAEFGLVATALAFIAILNSFSDLGLGKALVQNKENISITYSSVFFINVISSIFIVIVLQFFAYYIGDFYNNLELTNLIRLLSFILIINSFSTVQNAIFSRNLDFKSLNIRLLLAVVTGGIVGITTAFYGYGIYALAAQQLVNAAIGGIVIWTLSSWRPKLEFSMLAIKGLFDFSAYTFLNRVTQELIKRMDVLVIGKLFSTTTLGFYGRAESLVNIVRVLSTQSLNKVFFPVMSRLQDNDDAYKKIFFTIFDLILLIIFFISGCTVLAGEYLIITLFGEKWEQSVIIFQILMIKIFAYPINSFLILTLLAKGFAKENFFHSIVRKTIYLSSFIVAFFWGFTAFLYALIIVSFIGTLYNIWVNFKYLNISYIYQIKQLCIFGFTFTGAVSASNFMKIPMNNELCSLILQMLTYTVIYFFTLFLCNRQLLIRIHKVAIKVYNSIS